MLSTSHIEITPSSRTLANKDIFARSSSGIGRSARQTRAVGKIPISRNFCTLCCVGLVFNSPAVAIKGTSVRCTYATWLRLRRKPICRAASKKGSDSMSPTVPPISTIATSTLPSCDAAAPRSTKACISLVICGITCTVFPRYSPRRSLRITLSYI